MAGLWFSHRVSRTGSVLLVTKKADTESNTNYAQGGIAAAVETDDSARLHCEDTIRAGGGIAHPDLVRLVTEGGPGLVRELFSLGVPFNTYADASGHEHFDLGQEGGHRRRRIVHAHDFTGAEIEHGLLRAVRSNPNVTMLEEHFAVDLVLDDSGRCCGARVLDTSSGTVEIAGARVCLLATGGAGQAWLHTTNPRIATGDGVAMGYRAGARIANMEFVQFHPTALYGHLLEGRAFLISEAVRGEGAVLRTRDGHAFMPAYHPDADLAPRDVVARAIATELKQRGGDYVLLDATHLDPRRLCERFPNISRTCLRLGIDITRQPIPVVPAAHYICGGIETNDWAETSVPGLYAAGECACSGLHGANRLASNSLLEALVMADRAAERAVESSDSRVQSPEFRVRGPELNSGLRSPVPDSGSELVAGLRQRLQDLMWQYAGIVRSDAGLAEARRELMKLAGEGDRTGQTVAAMELRNLLAASLLVVECAIRRLESRGLHYNEDHPNPDDRYKRDTVVSRSEIESPAS
ncbi:L-aspartate oxidase [candidate division WOR-3 bacterium]|uniref:L-aspartate oxidase n=1 Tax=candidate division WOR-3 bacterium TaxID=2052148 RepID=A0A937XF18_UNCW3|nr:L-aspartate oxidase [candidate division WOR-3 bacterium]